MTAHRIDRRALLLGAATLSVASLLKPFSAFAATSEKTMQVFASPSCGCCKGWVDHVRANGYEAEVTHIEGRALDAKKTEVGLTPQNSSCHTALIDGYVVEGHVPASEIDRLLAERPDALGLTVPGMPMDAPGMGSGNTPFEVLLVQADGSTEVFARYPKG